MLPSSFKTKGFTLIELLLVIVVIALLSIAALSSMMKSQDQFRFKSVVNETANILRTIRNYALSNKPAPTNSAPQYGAVITANSTTNTITIFGDTNNNGTYDAPPPPPTIPPNPPTDHFFKTYTIPANSGKYELYNGTDVSPVTTGILTLLYKPTTANFSIKEPEFTERYAVLKITDSVDTTRSNYIVIFKESGNPEVLNNLSEIQ